jgi:RNA polymerase sigma-70 factor, ECF subfamily
VASFAFEIVEHLPRLKRYASCLQRDRADAEELVQETIAHALANAHLYRHGGNLCGWLVMMMHNLYVNALRSRRRERIFLTGAAVPELGCAPTQEAPVELREIRRAVARLPRQQGEALVLHWLFGLECHEVAATLGIPHGTVLSRISRARTALRAMLAEPRSGLGLAHRDGPPEAASRPADERRKNLAPWPAAAEPPTSPYRVYAEPIKRPDAGRVDERLTMIRARVAGVLRTARAGA